MNSSPLAHLAGSTIELLVGCTDLADTDGLTKSDPMCVLFYKQFGQWKEYGRTEAVRNTLNPKFTESFVLEFDPSLQQSLMFTVYDIDSRSSDLKHHDLVGSVEVTLTDLLTPVQDLFTTCKTLRVAGDSRARGIISITSEVLRKSKNKLSMHVGGHGLDKTGKIIMTKPEAYLEISRSIDNVSYHPVFRSETCHKSQKPRWRPFDVSLQKLCNGDWDRLIQLSVWHHSGNGEYKMLGRKVTTVRELKLLKSEGHYKEVALVPKKNGKLKNSIKITTCGHLRFYHFRVDCQYSLLDYIRGGLQLHPIIGIDFTSSNGRLNEELCLHDLTNERGNQYTDVLDSLGSMLSQYNNDQRVAMLGFGAKLPNSEKTSNCFPLSEGWDNLYAKGIKNAINMYKSSAKRLRFSGPSMIKPIIAMAESLAIKQPTQDRQSYHVLILITDGVINDIEEAVERLISISHLPLSIVFVGVGPADFSLMEGFSHHNSHLMPSDNTSSKRTRINTHFVAFNRDDLSSANNDMSSRDAFAVISAQIVDFLKSKDISPNRPKLTMTDSTTSSLVDVEMDTFESTSSLKRLSSFSEKSQRLFETSGPKCPTCGSTLELGSFLHNEISSIT